MYNCEPNVKWLSRKFWLAKSRAHEGLSVTTCNRAFLSTCLSCSSKPALLALDQKNSRECFQLLRRSLLTTNFFCVALFCHCSLNFNETKSAQKWKSLKTLKARLQTRQFVVTWRKGKINTALFSVRWKRVFFWKNNVRQVATINFQILLSSNTNRRIW